MTGLLIEVLGSPAPQGSKAAFRNKYTGKIQQVESSKKVAPWRQDVRQAAIDAAETARWQPIDGPVSVSVTFRFQRPSTHYGTGRNAHQIKASAPSAPCTRASYDGDKLLRSTWDALVQAGVLTDDSQITEWAGAKVYCEPGELTGATIYITPIGAAIRTETAIVQGSLL